MLHGKRGFGRLDQRPMLAWPMLSLLVVTAVVEEPPHDVLMIAIDGAHVCPRALAPRAAQPAHPPPPPSRRHAT